MKGKTPFYAIRRGMPDITTCKTQEVTWRPIDARVPWDTSSLPASAYEAIVTTMSGAYP